HQPPARTHHHHTHLLGRARRLNSSLKTELPCRGWYGKLCDSLQRISPADVKRQCGSYMKAR
ncbi:MAG TPA: hypothetical protein PLJ30_14255, partial [Deltaproteobacteria bacterium]|nr:hypothetical protein [Deltaproteobacteria bacterium]